MYQYYFFRIDRTVNQSAQLRTILRPIPGQFTYKTRMDRRHPIDPNYRVQLCNAENHLAVQLCIGDIVCVKHEGANEKACRLSEYSRDDTPFYRTEAKIYYVCNDTDESASCPIASLQSADDDMREAYTRLVQGNDNRDENHGVSQSAQSQTHVQSAPANEHVRSVAQTSLNFDELNRIEDSIRDSMRGTVNERDVQKKLLTISQIRDRMRLGVAKFTYDKQNGDVRVAYGTRNRQVIAEIGETASSEEGTRRGGEDGAHFAYFDIQRRAWRCFCTCDIRTVDTSIFLTDMDAIRNIATL